MMRARFREHYEQSARFREDRALAEELTMLAEPVLEALSRASLEPADCRSLRDVYALLALLCQRAAALDATASVAVTLPAALVQALRAAEVELDAALLDELSLVATEAYCAARDERTQQQLRRAAAESQVCFNLAPRCRAVVLAGSHREPDLSPTLERMARELLRDNIAACLLELSRLSPIEEDVARAVGRFCAHAATLGVQTFVVGASTWLRERFAEWSLAGPPLHFVQEQDRAVALALGAVGLHLRPRRRWARLFLPARSGLVR